MKEYIYLTQAYAQMGSGKRAGAEVEAPLCLASPPGQEPADLRVCWLLSLTLTPSCANRTVLVVCFAVWGWITGCCFCMQ